MGAKITSIALGGLGLGLGALALVPLAHATTFYPNAFPSQWYVLPGQQLSFNGSNFPPNDTVTIQGGGMTITASTSGSGQFTSNAITVPFGWQNSRQSFTATAASDGVSTPNPITVEIGSFYPQLNPSSWWIGFNQGMSASATGFAPGEQVKLIVNGNQVGQMAADGSGNATFSFTTPGSGNSATLTAQGLSSGKSVSQTIFLHG